MGKHKLIQLVLKSWATMIPVMVVAIFSSALNYQNMSILISNLSNISAFQDKSAQLTDLLKTQDTATTSMVIDPETMLDVSEVKLDAYDHTIELLDGIQNISPNSEINQNIEEIKQVDQEHIKPVEEQLLELLFEDEEKARQLYLGEYQRSKAELNQSFKKLTNNIHQYAKDQQKYMLEKETRSILINSFILFISIGIVLASLFFLSVRIFKGEEDLNCLLGSLSEGLFFFDKEGHISSKRSNQLESMLPGSEKIHYLDQLFGKHLGICPEKDVTTVLGLLWSNDNDGFMSSFEDTVSMLPSVLVRKKEDGNQIIKIRYQPIYKDANKQSDLASVVVGLTDVTKALEMERKQKEQKLRVERIEKAAVNMTAFKNFAEDTINLLKSVDEMMESGEINPKLDRDLHTLKGNLAMYGFTSISNTIHKIEDMPEKGKNKLCLKDWSHVKSQWKFEMTDIEVVLGLRNFDGKVVTSKEKIELLRNAAKKEEIISELVDALERVHISEALSKYADLVNRLSDRDYYKKAEVKFDSQSDDVLYNEINRIDNSLIHIIRNCFDHGIEDQMTREQHNKPAIGVIRISLFRKPDHSLHLIIRDDGKGIDAEKLLAVASKKGIISKEEAAKMTDQDKLSLIFRDSLSSKDQASDLSGRGVGMSAVKSQIEEMGGSIDVFSHPGQGSQFKIVIPPLTNTMQSHKSS